MVFPQVWGNGYSVVDAILHNRLVGWLLLAVLLAKVASTASTVGSGAVGGVFTPTLFIGAAVGALTGSTLRLAFPHMTSGAGAFAVVGMGGFLAATTHAPLTSVLMIFEMTLDHQVVLPLILACVTAHYVAKVYRGGASIYRESLMPAAASGSAAAAWYLRTIADLIKPAGAVVREATTVQRMLETLPRRPVRAVYIVNGDQELVASLDPRDSFAKVKRREISPDTAVLALSTPMQTTLTPDLSLTAALELFLRDNATELPVVANPWRMTLLGTISRHDLLLALQDRMSDKRTT
jgi:CIC family chloride channel protein